MVQLSDPVNWRKFRQGHYIAILLLAVFIWMFYYIDVLSDFKKVNPTINIVDETGFLVKTPGCRIPELDPMDPSIKHLVELHSAIVCSDQPPLVSSNMTAIFINESALIYYNITEINIIKCCYKSFHRPEGNSKKYSQGVDSNIKFGNACIPFILEAIIEEEYIQVTCSIDNQEIYRDYFAFVHVPKNTTTLSEDKYSILMIGVDAVSRLNMHRQMKGTVKMLQELGGKEMLGYNKVADNTFPNLVPILAGLSEEELKTACWPSDKHVFDNCPWLFYNFSANNYKTAFGEDAPWMGIFSYLKVGFARQPTDIYLRPFSKQIEDDIGHMKKWNAKMCVGSRMTAEVLIDFISKFARTMINVPTFALFWSASLSHDDVNYASAGDNLYINLLTDLKESGVLEKTILIFLSDHGIRWGNLRETFQGRLEERLPFLWFLFPPTFRERYATAVANIHRNARRLTTPYDLHYTLSDLLVPDLLEQDSIKKRMTDLQIQPTVPRGISLFLQISENRTCDVAGITDHWCTCQESHPINVTDSLVQKAANFLVVHINKKLSSFKQCAKLSLDEIVSARLQIAANHISEETKDTRQDDVLIVLRTVPGNALFEATVRYKKQSRILNIAGGISRINKYGSSSSCVADYLMRLYCYCE